MFEHRSWRAIALGFSVVLAGCGGGGGGSSAGNGNSVPGAFGAQFTVASAEASGVTGSPDSVTLTANLSFTGDSDLFLEVEYDPAVVLDVQGQVSGSTLSLTMTLRGDLAVGSYPSQLLLHACLDEACTQEPSGSPVSLPVHYAVTPNLQVQQQVTLSRSGADPAPSVSLPVTIPAAAGNVIMGVATSRPDAIAASFDGNQLLVQTEQVPAGTYSATVTLYSQADPRYSRSVDISYTVLAPAGGEQPLSVADSSRSVIVQQGAQSVQHLVVTRPTWTDAWDPPVLNDASGIATLTDLGNDQYDVTIDAVGRDQGSYSVVVAFSAGPTGGTAAARLSVSVTGAFYWSGDQFRSLDATSTTADLGWQNAIVTYDGVPATWTAVSLSPMLHVVNASGRTGVDSLQFALDPAAPALPDLGLPLFVQISLDRPGTSPTTVQYGITNLLPSLQRVSPATLVGDSGRIYIEGSLQQFGGRLLSSGRLHVTGATLANAQFISDSRFVGDLPVLALDVTGAVAGTPIIISVDSPLLPTQVQVQVQAPLQATAGYQALPFASFRPPQFAPGLGALYFASAGIAYRWGYSGGAWSLSQASIDGLLDVAPSPDDTTLFASDPGHVTALDPATLAQQSIGTLASVPITTEDFDPSPMPAARTLAFSADGRALGSISDINFVGLHGIGWICTPQTDRHVPALTSAPQPCDPDVRMGPGLAAPSGYGMVRSANGTFIEGIGAHGDRTIYQAALRSWLSAPAFAAGLTLAAVSDSGSRVVRSDGMLLDGNDTELGNLASLVPFTHTPGGYGLSSGGRFGYIYGYRLTGTTPQSATDATLWVVDLNNAASAGVASAPIVATLSLPQAVGCTSALVAGETCQHTASVISAPGDGTVFVLGPRGVAALLLPASVTGAAPLSNAPGRAKATSAKARSPLHGTFSPTRESR